jgi:Family of unknown function (DUF5675)
MADANIPKFVFYRTNEVVEHGDFKGNRGILQVNGTLYFTVEREIARYVHIPLGTYTLKMESSPTKKRDDVPRQQFRIMGHNVPAERGGLANLLIHDGNYPGGLEGCIAPGKSQIPGGVGQSRIAMDELFNACGGGFQPKDDAAILDVVSKPIIQDPTGTYPTF